MELNSDLLQKICCNQPANILRFGFVTVLVLCSEVIIEDRLILCAVFLEITHPLAPQNLVSIIFFPPLTVFGMFKGYGVFGVFKGYRCLVCLKVNVFPVHRAAPRQ